MINNMKEYLDKCKKILSEYDTKIIIDNPKYIDNMWTELINTLRTLGMKESTIELLPRSLDYNNGINGSIGEYITNYDNLEEIHNYFIIMSETVYYTKNYIWKSLNYIHESNSIDDISVAIKTMIIYKELSNMREVSTLVNYLRDICIKHKLGIFKYDSE